MTMKLNFQLTTLLLTLTVGLAQTALAQESARAVVWCVTTSSKAKSLEKAREAHKALLEGLREQQTLLKVEDEDIFIDSPELHRIMYRTRPGGYEFRQRSICVSVILLALMTFSRLWLRRIRIPLESVSVSDP